LKALTTKELIIDVDSGEQTDKQSLTLRRSRKTKFFKSSKEIQPSEIPTGAHITLDATRDPDQKLSALNVTVAP
jgi:hypothetical protein